MEQFPTVKKNQVNKFLSENEIAKTHVKDFYNLFWNEFKD